MKRLAALLAFLIAIEYTSCLQTIAATATFSGNGAQAQVPVTKVGALLLADAVAFLNNDSIEVRSKSQQDSSQNMLQGTVLNTEVVGAGASRHIHGIAFFQSGSSIAGLRKGSGPERVKTTSGEVLEGPITNVTADGLNCGSSHVPSGGISCIQSPTAFEFDIALSGASGTSSVTGEATKMSFSQCNVPVASTKVKQEKTPRVSSGEPNTKMRIIVCTLLLAGIATAIAVPIAVGAHRHHHRHRDNTQQILLQNFLAERARTPTQSVMETISNPFQSSSSSTPSSP